MSEVDKEQTLVEELRKELALANQKRELAEVECNKVNLTLYDKSSRLTLTEANLQVTREQLAETTQRETNYRVDAVTLQRQLTEAKTECDTSVRELTTLADNHQKLIAHCESVTIDLEEARTTLGANQVKLSAARKDLATANNTLDTLLADNSESDANLTAFINTVWGASRRSTVAPTLAAVREHGTLAKGSKPAKL